MKQKPTGTEIDRLVTEARSGDHEAFATLYRNQVGFVYAFALRLVGNKPGAETLTQDVFIRAWEKLDRFEGRGSFRSWLRKLTLNLALEERRVESRWERIGALKIMPRTRIEAHEPAIDLERAIAELPDGARKVFVLHEVYGYKQVEIADETRKALGTVKSQLHRARRLLRESLNSEMSDSMRRLRQQAGGKA